MLTSIEVYPLTASCGATAAVPTVALPLSTPTLITGTVPGSNFTLTSSIFTATACTDCADLSAAFHSLPLLCCAVCCGSGCSCVGSAACRGDGARPKLNGRCVGERNGGGVDEADDEVGDDCREPYGDGCDCTSNCVSIAGGVLC